MRPRDEPSIRSDRIEVRVSPDELDRIGRAASIIGLSASAFMIGAAVDRAEDLIAATTTTVLPAAYFDELVATLDRPDDAPRLAAAAERTQRTLRIVAR